MTPELELALADFLTFYSPEINRGEIRHIGTFNCRRKNNKPGAPWSEHSWPNAADIMLKNWSGRKALGDDIAAYMRARPNLWSEVFWQIPAHYDHVHGTANPRRNHDNKQIPPCAGGPDMDYKKVKNVPQKEWAKSVVDWGIAEGLIIVSDDHVDDWNAPLTYGAYWTLEHRRKSD